MQTWPYIPALPAPWMNRRARLWRQWLITGQTRRFQLDFRTVTGGTSRGRASLHAYGLALRAEWHRRIEQGPAGPALRRADHPNYLGDRAVVRGLIDGWFALQIARAGGAVPHEAVEQETARLVHIFTGSDPAYPPIGGWNTQPLLGAALRHHYALPDGPFDTTLGNAFGAAGLSVLSVLQGAETGSIAPGQAVGQLKPIATQLVDALLGHANG